MINLKPTKVHKKNIKTYKRLIEKSDLWTFAFKHNEEYYFIASYKQQITGKVTGYLILNGDGNVPSREEAKIPLYNFVLFNTKADNTGTEMVQQMNKSMKPYEEMYKALIANKNYILKENPQMESTIDAIISQSKEGMERPEKIREIVMKLGSMQREVTRGTGYFEKSFLDRFEEEYAKYGELIYTFIKREEKLKGNYEELKRVVSSQEKGLPTQDKKDITRMLDAWLSSFERVLTKSISTFELDERGNKLHIDLTNIKSSLAKSREEIAERDFINIILPILRNPK